MAKPGVLVSRFWNRVYILEITWEKLKYRKRKAEIRFVSSQKPSKIAFSGQNEPANLPIPGGKSWIRGGKP